MSGYIPIDASDALRRVKAKKKQVTISGLVLAFFLIVFLVLRKTSSNDFEIPECRDCGSYKALQPAFTGQINEILYDEDYKLHVIGKLSRAVQHPTQIFDDTPAPTKNTLLSDDWKNFTSFHTYLEETFPHVFSTLKVEKVNFFGLLLTWEPETATENKPVVLMAHQDVVPVEPNTINKWTHPPFEGFYDSEKDLIYGRGVCDCKQLLISQLEAVEKLIQDGYKPENRALILSMGFDEEASGTYGADQLSKFLENRYGKNGIYAIVDEGGSVAIDNGDYFAGPVGTEKGYLDAWITLNTPGGHSSVPNAHTSIGLISLLNVLLENDPYEQAITPNNPVLEQLQCYAKYFNMNPELKKAISKNDIETIGELINNDLSLKYYFQTSQAIDIIKGGVKSNALPEQVTVLVNNRIGIHSSVQDVVDHILKHLQTVAEEYDLTITLEKDSGKQVSIREEGANGDFVFRMFSSLEPAPISPTGNDTFWEILAGTTVSVYAHDLFNTNGTSNVYVAPSLSTGNTDTRFYWRLTNRIYRFTGALEDIETNEHTVDEKITGKSLISNIAYMYEFIPNIDKYAR